mmetsp:Transcript_37641/g.94369  ORF Transcript_37641/g.94369 Transcript_37641/m.94369 type:complete len:414 (-) Transcript_37641:1044-2285(-)
MGPSLLAGPSLAPPPGIEPPPAILPPRCVGVTAPLRCVGVTDAWRCVGVTDPLRCVSAADAERCRGLVASAPDLGAACPTEGELLPPVCSGTTSASTTILGSVGRRLRGAEPSCCRHTGTRDASSSPWGGELRRDEAPPWLPEGSSSLDGALEGILRRDPGCGRAPTEVWGDDEALLVPVPKCLKTLRCSDWVLEMSSEPRWRDWFVACAAVTSVEEVQGHWKKFLLGKELEREMLCGDEGDTGDTGPAGDLPLAARGEAAIRPANELGMGWSGSLSFLARDVRATFMTLGPLGDVDALREVSGLRTADLTRWRIESLLPQHSVMSVEREWSKGEREESHGWSNASEAVGRLTKLGTRTCLMQSETAGETVPHTGSERSKCPLSRSPHSEKGWQPAIVSYMSTPTLQTSTRHV